MYFQASRAGAFLTKLVSFFADKCRRKDLWAPGSEKNLEKIVE